MSFDLNLLRIWDVGSVVYCSALKAAGWKATVKMSHIDRIIDIVLNSMPIYFFM